VIAIVEDDQQIVENYDLIQLVPFYHVDAVHEDHFEVVGD